MAITEKTNSRIALRMRARRRDGTCRVPAPRRQTPAPPTAEIRHVAGRLCLLPKSSLHEKSLKLERRRWTNASSRFRSVDRESCPSDSVLLDCSVPDNVFPSLLIATQCGMYDRAVWTCRYPFFGRRCLVESCGQSPRPSSPENPETV